MQLSDEAIAKAVDRFSAIRDQGTLANLLAFGRVLKEVGLKVGLSRVLDASRSLEFVDITHREDFHAVLRSNLLSEREGLPLFDRVFDCFWSERSLQDAPVAAVEVPGDSLEGGNSDSQGPLEGGGEISSHEAEPDEKAEPSPFPTYSPIELLSHRDFSSMGIEESRALSRALLLIAAKIATQLSRRKRRALRGAEIDPRWTMRRSLKYGGEVVDLVERRRRIKKTRIVLLCDVSGSMDCYSRFLIQFMYGLQNELWGVETFVFSTALSRITHLIRSREIASALEGISSQVLGWSGGTNIGRSLRSFNREFAPTLVNHRTVVVVISDGWDRGDVSLLEREMRDLRRRCYKIIWLNPLLASENYEPLCKGMQAALPYLDFFLSLHNLNSLMALGRTLKRLVT